MTSRAGRQFCLLLWKNYLIQKRKIFVTFLEIGLPTFFSILLVLVRQRVIANEVYNATTWPAYGITHLPKHLCPVPSPFPCLPWRLYFTPKNNLTEDIMSKVQLHLGHKRIGGRQSLVILFCPTLLLYVHIIGLHE